ncbi:hypothetical protein Tco_0288916 [Tanacetum coccineum]
MVTCEPADTPMVEKSKLDEDPQRQAVDATRYRRMVGTLMCLIASRPDLIFVVCVCAWLPRYQKEYICKNANVGRKISELVVKETEEYGHIEYRS